MGGPEKSMIDIHVLIVLPIMSTLDWNACQVSEFNLSTASSFAPKTLKNGCFTYGHLTPENESRLVPIMIT